MVGGGGSDARGAPRVDLIGVNPSQVGEMFLGEFSSLLTVVLWSRQGGREFSVFFRGWFSRSLGEFTGNFVVVAVFVVFQCSFLRCGCPRVWFFQLLGFIGGRRRSSEVFSGCFAIVGRC